MPQRAEPLIATSCVNITEIERSRQAQYAPLYKEVPTDNSLTLKLHSNPIHKN